jgi:hypothetical protein
VFGYSLFVIMTIRRNKQAIRCRCHLRTLAPVRLHSISHQLMGTNVPPETLLAETTPKSFSAVER